MDSLRGKKKHTFKLNNDVFTITIELKISIFCYEFPVIQTVSFGILHSVHVDA